MNEKQRKAIEEKIAQYEKILKEPATTDWNYRDACYANIRLWKQQLSTDSMVVGTNVPSNAPGRRATPVVLCPICNGQRTILVMGGDWVTCTFCSGHGTKRGIPWGVCRHCGEDISQLYNCCTKCADERGP